MKDPTREDAEDAQAEVAGTAEAAEETVAVETAEKATMTEAALRKISKSPFSADARFATSGRLGATSRAYRAAALSIWCAWRDGW